MDNSPRLRDKFYSAAPHGNLSGKSAPQNSAKQPPKESLEKVLEDGFKAEMKGLKMGCLILWHVGGILFLLLILFIALGTIYQIIFG